MSCESERTGLCNVHVKRSSGRFFECVCVARSDDAVGFLHRIGCAVRQMVAHRLRVHSSRRATKRNIMFSDKFLALRGSGLSVVWSRCVRWVPSVLRCDCWLSILAASTSARLHDVITICVRVFLIVWCGNRLIELMLQHMLHVDRRCGPISSQCTVWHRDFCNMVLVLLHTMSNV